VFVAVGWFLVKVAVLTIAAVGTAAAVLAGAASNVDSVNNVKDGAKRMLGVDNPPARHVLVDEWDNPDGFWQSPNVDQRLDYQRTADRWIGAGQVAAESVKAAVKAASPVKTVGFDYAEKYNTIREYHADRATSPHGVAGDSTESGSSASAGSTGGTPDGSGNPTETATDDSWICEDGVEWGCDIEVRPGPTQTQDVPSAQASMQGTYYFNPDASTYLPDWADPASVTEISGDITIDDDASFPVLGEVDVSYLVRECGGGSGIDCLPGQAEFSIERLSRTFWSFDSPSGGSPTANLSVHSGEPGVYEGGVVGTGEIEGRRLTITSAGGSRTYVFDRP
jgi:hypothetical protein